MRHNSPLAVNRKISVLRPENKDAGIALAYAGKEAVEGILGEYPSGLLEEIESFGGRPLVGWRNRFIYGDNLSALRLMRYDTEVKGKVRLVYIDPPFSTGQVFKHGEGRTATVSRSEDDSTAYDDTRIGADYLEFLRKRLVVLRELMADDGTIYVHIDGKMGHYVKVLMDEVFGQERFINDITRVKCNPKNFDRKGFGNVKDIILVYSKTNKYVWNDSRERLTEDDRDRLFPKTDGDGRRYTTTPLHAPGETRNGPTGKQWRGLMPPKGRHWRYPPEELEKLDKARLVEWSSTGNPRKKIYADDVSTKGKKRQDIWEFKDPPYPDYPTEKNLNMLKMIVKTSSNPGDIVLDCFAGSGTTLVAAEEKGRRWIGIDNSTAALKVFQKRINELSFSPYALYKIETELKAYAGHGISEIRPAFKGLKGRQRRTHEKKR